MSDIEKQIEKLEKLIKMKRIELIRRQTEIDYFVGTNHKAKSTKPYREEMLGLATEINDFVICILEMSGEEEKHKKQIEGIYEKGLELRELTRDMSKALAEDLLRRQKDEEIDYSKATSLATALNILCITISRYTFDPSSSHIGPEIGTATLAALLITFHKGIAAKLKQTSKELCRLPRDIKESFLLYYFKKTGVQTAARLAHPLNNEKSFLIVNSRGETISKGKATGKKPKQLDAA